MNLNLIVASRESKLAVVQTNMVIESIKKHHQEIDVSLLTMKTTGDIILDKTLDKIGGKGLFVKELDKALLQEKADITVHSYKDMPMIIDDRLPIVALSKREDPRDVLILPMGATQIDMTKPIGCSSKRREIQLRAIYPNISVKPIRGNVQTRLQKLDSGEYSAIVLAYAGIKRLSLEDRISRIFSVDEIIPAACQGVICVQSKENTNNFYLSEFDCSDSHYTSNAERAFVRALDGGCSSPVAAYATLDGENINLTGFYVNQNEEVFIETVCGNKNDCEKIGRDLATKLKEKGKVKNG